MKKLVLLLVIFAGLQYSCSKEDLFEQKLIASWDIVKAQQFSSCSSYDDISATFTYKRIEIFENKTVSLYYINDSVVHGQWDYFQTSSKITIEDADGLPLILTTFFDHIDFQWDSPVEYLSTSTIDLVNGSELVLKNPHKDGPLLLHFQKAS